MTEHTPTPWRLYHFQHPGAQPTIAIMAGNRKTHNEVVHWTGFDASHFPEQALENAKQIVKAVNSHEALVEALQLAEAVLNEIAVQRGGRLEVLAPIRRALASVGAGYLAPSLLSHSRGDAAE